MGDYVVVPYGKSASDTAVLLLAAAEELGIDQAVVRTIEGAFVAPKEVAQRAGVEPPDEGEEKVEEPPVEEPPEKVEEPKAEEPPVEEQVEEPEPKKAPTKKPPTKRAAKKK